MKKLKLALTLSLAANAVFATWYIMANMKRTRDEKLLKEVASRLDKSTTELSSFRQDFHEMTQTLRGQNYAMISNNDQFDTFLEEINNYVE